MNILLIIQIVVSLLLMAVILLQTPDSSLGSTFGGTSTHFHTKKGAEKFMFGLTLTLSFLFVAVSLLNIIL